MAGLSPGGRGPWRGAAQAFLLAATAGAVAVVAPEAGAQDRPGRAGTGLGAPSQQAGRPRGQTATCELCHGKLEFLRQRTGSIRDARSLLAPLRELRASAHGELECAECHDGFERFPHESGTRTRSCASCHADADTAWGGSAHDGPDLASTARCQDCHGIHDVRAAEETSDRPAAMNEHCVSCHATAALATGDSHAGEAACFSCHRPHSTRRIDDPLAAVARARQGETCGTCHDTVSAAWRDDVHGTAVLEDASAPGGAGLDSDDPDPPTCVTCHGAHPTHTLSDGSAPPGAEVPRCADCHEEYADTFGDSYHGQATELGSEAAASCADCHTAHSILPASDPRSSVAEGRLVETCGSCHPRANASFVEFEPHADPHDREKNPVLYWTYRFMTFLLWGVLGVFGLHTLLWLLRAALERREAGSGGRESDGKPGTTSER